MEENQSHVEVENEWHVVDRIVDLYSRNYSGESFVSANESESDVTLTDGLTAPLNVQRSISSSSLSASPPPLSTMPLENIGFEAPATIVAQERNNIQALKRISLDASSTSDPDLPAVNIALLQHGPTSPPAASPSSAASVGTQQGFPFDDAPGYHADSALLWVPAHLHPELAPKEWRTFVQERVAEIQQRTGANGILSQSEKNTTSPASPISALLSVPGSSGTTGSGVIRRKSKLSREIDISDDSVAGFEDGADVLQERSRTKSPEVRVSDLEWLETYARQTRSASGSPNIPGGVVISEGNAVHAPLNRGKGLRRSQHTSRKNKRLFESEKRLSMTSEETLSEDENDERHREPNLNVEQPSPLTATPPSYSVPDRGPQVTVTDGKLQLNINETDLGSLDFDTDVVIEAAKSVDSPDVAVTPDDLHHAGSGSTSSSSTSSSTVSSVSIARESSFPERICSAKPSSGDAGRRDQHRSSPRPGTPVPTSSTHRPSPVSRLTSKRLITDMLSRSSSTSSSAASDFPESPATPFKLLTPSDMHINAVLSVPSMAGAVSGDPNGRTNELSVVPALDAKTADYHSQSPQPGPSLMQRGKALTAGFGRLFTSDKDKEKDKKEERKEDRSLGHRSNALNQSAPSRSGSVPDLNKEARRRETIDLERPATPIANVEKGSSKKEKESKLSNFFGAKKKSLTKSNAGRRSKNKNGGKAKHVRTSRSSSSLSSTYTDPYVGKSQSPSTPPSPSRTQMVNGNGGRPYYYSRFPLHVERAIYRLSHLKLANPRRPLRQQVLLSNFMYSYLELINQDSMYGYQQQQCPQAYQYSYPQQQFIYQQQVQQQNYQNWQLQLHHHRQSQQLLHQQEMYSQRQRSQRSYSDEENMFAGLESSVASDRQINRSVNEPAYSVQGGSKSDNVDSYWQDSDSDDDVYGTYFDPTDDDYPVAPVYDDEDIDEDEDNDVRSVKPNSSSLPSSQIYIPGETYYETISRQQQEQAQRQQFEQHPTYKSSSNDSYNYLSAQNLSHSRGPARYHNVGNHQSQGYNGYPPSSHYYETWGQAQVVGGYNRD
ncbi:hypothetical protein POJ06DRAFT_235077 [Lipomyces tetrasporus]|uniref:Protein Zds1 C-terminal domain-containing protein n=1 Tax=Lipomyces tetrasporus TaxID=54092 RepID=A0AAD7VVC5_9ASCO|nr:uncharacterized protein POJ06DRAFT_235077 [Lipomyces tetrasporus]KAJ8104107.1 hypothetical protein POJ06DRAFT_235077 [Lipomyces tetrasporus]